MLIVESKGFNRRHFAGELIFENMKSISDSLGGKVSWIPDHITNFSSFGISAIAQQRVCRDEKLSHDCGYGQFLALSRSDQLIILHLPIGVKSCCDDCGQITEGKYKDRRISGSVSV